MVRFQIPTVQPFFGRLYVTNCFIKQSLYQIQPKLILESKYAGDPKTKAGIIPNLNFLKVGIQMVQILNGPDLSTSRKTDGCHFGRILNGWDSS